jgi:uncharacterized membrane protein
MSATPVPELDDPAVGPRLALPSRVNSAGAGWDWIAVGWKLFTRAPLMWVLSIVVLFVAAVVFHIVPFIGAIAFQLIQGAIAGGFMVACHSLSRGGDFEIEHLFAGFKRNFVQLLLLGVFLVVGGLLILLVLAMFVGATVVSVFMGGGNADAAMAAIAGSAVMMLLGCLVALALTVPMMAAYWFAPALVILNNMSAAAALKESFFGSMRNFVAFLVYGIIMTVFAVLAVLPFGLGMLVWIPLAITSTYAAYRGIFTESPLDEPAVTV